MKTRTALFSGIFLGALLGGGGVVLASQAAKPAPTPVDPFERMFQQINQNMDHMFNSTFAEIPDLNISDPAPASTAQITRQDDKMVIKIRLENPKNEIRVKAQDDYVTVTEQRENKTKNSAEAYNSTQSFSVDPGYDASKMSQKIDGGTLVITIPRQTTQT